MSYDVWRDGRVTNYARVWAGGLQIEADYGWLAG